MLGGAFQQKTSSRAQRGSEVGFYNTLQHFTTLQCSEWSPPDSPWTGGVPHSGYLDTRWEIVPSESGGGGRLCGPSITTYHLWGSGDNAHNFAHTARTDKRTVASDSPCKVRPIVPHRAKNARLGGVLDFPKSPPGRRCKSGTATHFRKPRSAATFSVSRAVRNCPSNVHPMPVRANSGGEAQTPSRLPRAVTHS